MSTLVVFAKVPAAGHAKTRLCPPLTHEQAAAVAEAMLDDTIELATSLAGEVGVVLSLAASPGAWRPPTSCHRIAWQEDGTVEARVDAALRVQPPPVLLLPADVPHVERHRLAAALDALEEPTVDIVIGPAPDGGFWCLGVAVEVAEVIGDVQVSSPSCTTDLLARWRARGLRVRVLDDVVRDVDSVDDALDAAARTPTSRLAATIRRTGLGTTASGASQVAAR